MLKATLMVLGTALIVWILAASFSSVQAQAQGSNTAVRIVGLGQGTSLPTDATGTPYLPMRDDRQLAISTESWLKDGDVTTLLLNSSLLPKQVTICGTRLSTIQGTLKRDQSDEAIYFPLTVNGTRAVLPDEGCYSVTPVAYLRIKGLSTTARSQMPNVQVWARY